MSNPFPKMKTIWGLMPVDEDQWQGFLWDEARAAYAAHATNSHCELVTLLKELEWEGDCDMSEFDDHAIPTCPCCGGRYEGQGKGTHEPGCKLRAFLDAEKEFEKELQNETLIGYLCVPVLCVLVGAARLWNRLQGRGLSQCPRCGATLDARNSHKPEQCPHRCATCGWYNIQHPRWCYYRWYYHRDYVCEPTDWCPHWKPKKER